MKQVLTIISFFFTASIATAQLVIQNGTTITTTGNALVTLKDIDLVNNGTIQQAPRDGKFLFSGNGNNIISGANSPTFDLFEINKTGSSKISLAQTIHIAGGINFTSGLIDLNNNNILLQPAAMLNGENENSRITGTTGGYVEIISSLNGPTSVNPGNLGAVFTTSQNLGSTIIRRGHTLQAINSTSNTIYRYYDIIPTNNTALNAVLRFYYFDAELNGQVENTLNLWKSPDNISWTNMGFTSFNSTNNYVEKTGITDFSRWTLNSSEGALPIIFSMFNVSCNNGTAIINWKTSQEQNSHQFEVQKSSDAVNWIGIGTIPAAGNSSFEKVYSYNDNNSLPGSFYRVVETDFSGIKKYTSIVHYSCNDGNNNIVTYPNPVTKQLFVSINSQHASTMIIKLFDSKGAGILQQQANLLSGTSIIPIEMTGFPSGVYHLSVWWNNGGSNKQVTVIKQ
jgi:hypothetical protein